MQNLSIKKEMGMAALIHEDIENTSYQSTLAEFDIETANFNSKKQVVITGFKQSIKEATPKLKESIAGLDVIELNVRSPFHSQFMKSIEPEFKDYLLSLSDKFNLNKSANVFSNLTGKLHEPNNLIKNLTNQISSSVKWIDNMYNMSKLCFSIYEIGA